MNTIRLVQDNYCRWCEIPADRLEQWYQWLNSEDADEGVTPAWADMLGSHIEQYVFVRVS